MEIVREVEPVRLAGVAVSLVQLQLQHRVVFRMEIAGIPVMFVVAETIILTIRVFLRIPGAGLFRPQRRHRPQRRLRHRIRPIATAQLEVAMIQSHGMLFRTVTIL